MNFSLEDKNLMVKAHFVLAFRNDNVTVFIAPHADGRCLVFKIAKISLPSYNSESTIYGKTIRLVIHLNDNYSLMRQLDMYDLNKVMVTEASEVGFSSRSNTAILDKSFLKETFSNLNTLRTAGGDIAEAGIKLLIG